jgi:glycosyltransferase involved in cell wall biosynthesis
MITVLHVITNLDRGGAETALFKLVTSNLVKERQRHIVVSLREHGVFGEKLESAGITVHALKMRNPLFFLSAFLRLIQLVRETQADVIHTWLYHADIIGGLAAKFGGNPPVIWGIHTVHLDSGSSHVTRVIRRLCAVLSKWIPAKIVCVAYAAAKVHVALGYDTKRIIVISNGFEIPEIETLKPLSEVLRRSLGLCDQNRVIGCVGRFHPDKDYPTFLQAAAEVAKRDRQVKFLLIGKGLAESNVILNEWIAKNGLCEHVIPLGERDDIYTCLSAMDIFCLPSATEAFPLVLGEAMSVSKPVVSTDVGDASILVGDAGLVVPSGNPRALSRALIKLLDLSDKERCELGAKARMRIEREFRIDSSLEKLLHVYNSLSNHEDV